MHVFNQASGHGSLINSYHRLQVCCRHEGGNGSVLVRSFTGGSECQKIVQHGLFFCFHDNLQLVVLFPETLRLWRRTKRKVYGFITFKSSRTLIGFVSASGKKSGRLITSAYGAPSWSAFCRAQRKQRTSSERLPSSVINAL